jgi:zinc protease
MSTMADELLHPTFPDDELGKLSSQSLSELEGERQETGGTGDAGAMATIAFAQSMFPKGHPYWEPSIDDSEAALKAVTPDTLRAFYSQYYRPDTTVLVVVGDVHTADVVAEVTKLFGGWAKPATPAPSMDIPTIMAPAIAPAPQLIAIPQTTQTSILWGFPGELKRTDKDFYPAYIMSYILGGDTFGSRLGKTIRDRLGLAYSVFAYFDAAHGAGAFSVFVGTNPANANHVTYLIRTITKAFLKSGATADEVRLAKEYLTGTYPIRLETNGGIAQQLLNSENYGLGLDFIQRREAIVNAVTVDQVNAAAHKYLHPDSATLVIAGATPGKE